MGLWGYGVMGLEKSFNQQSAVWNQQLKSNNRIISNRHNRLIKILNDKTIARLFDYAIMRF